MRQPLQQHPLQAWSDVLFPAWYVWWHIGLLAYHQQQQQPPSPHLPGHKLQRQLFRQANGSAPGSGSSQQQPLPKQPKQSAQQAGGKPRQLGRQTRLNIDIQPADTEQQQQQDGVGVELPSPSPPAAPQPQIAQAGGGNNSSSSSSRGPPTQQELLELYNNPDAR
jgi:hypothetical protein